VINLHREGSLCAEWSKVWGPYLILAITLQRFLSPGSDLLGSKWVEKVYGEGLEGIKLQHFYRALSFLSEKKNYVEERIFDKRRDLLINEVDIVFFDTSTLYFEGKGPEDFARRGKSKDNRPQENQIVVGVVMSREGRPISCMWWPGNTCRGGQ
jgi:transposase